MSFLTFLIISTNSAFADDSNLINEAEALAIDAKFYAASYDVPYDEAIRRLLIMHGTSSDISNIRNNVKGDLQGMYFDNSKNDFALKVNVANYAKNLPTSLTVKPKTSQAVQSIISSKGNSNLRKQFNISDADIRTVATQYSQPLSAPINFSQQNYKTKEQRLKNIESKREQLKKSLPELQLVYDDEKTGNAKVYVKSDKGNAKQIAEVLLAVPVEISVVPFGGRVVDIR
ncbi:hypothetical protein [Acinetobacter colistiniresistens]|nr:hypothetical protein [Acinetobacter colistiniresistens]